MYVCLCLGITSSQVRQAIQAGACTVAQVMECSAAGTCCGACRPTIAELVEEATGESGAAPPRRSLPLLPLVPSAA
jgi:bacterioferritin-associated ferredoxin